MPSLGYYFTSITTPLLEVGLCFLLQNSIFAKQDRSFLENKTNQPQPQSPPPPSPADKETEDWLPTTLPQYTGVHESTEAHYMNKMFQLRVAQQGRTTRLQGFLYVITNKRELQLELAYWRRVNRRFFKALPSIDYVHISAWAYPCPQITSTHQTGFRKPVLTLHLSSGSFCLPSRPHGCLLDLEELTQL